MTKVEQKIDNLIDKGEYVRARDVILRELKDTPDDHWLLAQLSNTYYEEKDYRKALQVARTAEREAPECPMVLWHLAGALDMMGQKKKAIAAYKKLLSRSVETLATEEGGEGLDWAKSLQADCKYRVALCYADLGNKVSYQRYLANYLKDRANGIESIYTDESDVNRLVLRRA